MNERGPKGIHRPADRLLPETLGTAGHFLKASGAAVWAAITQADVSGLVAALAAKLSASDARVPPTPSVLGRLLYDTGAAIGALASGAAGTFLKSNGTGASPTWEDPRVTVARSWSSGTSVGNYNFLAPANSPTVHSITGSDYAGVIDFTPGGAPTGGVFLDLYFLTAKANNPAVTWGARDATTAECLLDTGVKFSATTDGNKISFSTEGGLFAGTRLKISWNAGVFA